MGVVAPALKDWILLIQWPGLLVTGFVVGSASGPFAEYASYKKAACPKGRGERLVAIVSMVWNKQPNKKKHVDR